MMCGADCLFHSVLMVKKRRHMKIFFSKTVFFLIFRMFWNVLRALSFLKRFCTIFNVLYEKKTKNQRTGRVGVRMGLGIFEDEPDGRGEGCSYCGAIARAKLHASSATHAHRAVRAPHRAAENCS